MFAPAGTACLEQAPHTWRQSPEKKKTGSPKSEQHDRRHRFTKGSRTHQILELPHIGHSEFAHHIGILDHLLKREHVRVGVESLAAHALLFPHIETRVRRCSLSFWSSFRLTVDPEADTRREVSAARGRRVQRLCSPLKSLRVPYAKTFSRSRCAWFGPPAS
jgi:hypothetical protein